MSVGRTRLHLHHVLHFIRHHSAATRDPAIGSRFSALACPVKYFLTQYAILEAFKYRVAGCFLTKLDLLVNPLARRRAVNFLAPARPLASTVSSDKIYPTVLNVKGKAPVIFSQRNCHAVWQLLRVIRCSGRYKSGFAACRRCLILIAVGMHPSFAGGQGQVKEPTIGVDYRLYLKPQSSGMAMVILSN